MKSDAKIDDTVCWGGQMRGFVNKTSFPISFSVNSKDWTELDCAVVTDLSSNFSSLAEGKAILISGDESAFVASFKWGYYDTDENGDLQLRSDYGTKYYFVTSGTTSVSVPNTTRRGYTFQFLKWEYRSLNGTTWHDLASTPVVGFIIPGSMRVHAVYQSLTSPDLTLTAERYGTDGLMFLMQYVLPKGWKATNATVLYGDNHMVRYMEVVRSHTPVATLELSDPFLGILIPGTQIDVGTWDESTYYYDREDNLLSVDGNKGPLRVHMINGTAVNIPGYNEVIGKKADNLGQTSGYACGGLTGVKDANNGNHYIYVLGFVEYTDADGAEHLTAVGPIAVTYNSASSTITDTEIYTYNY